MYATNIMQFMEIKDAPVYRNNFNIQAYEKLKEKNSEKELRRIIKLHQSNKYDHGKQ